MNILCFVIMNQYKFKKIIIIYIKTTDQFTDKHNFSIPHFQTVAPLPNHHSTKRCIKALTFDHSIVAYLHSPILCPGA